MKCKNRNKNHTIKHLFLDNNKLIIIAILVVLEEFVTIIEKIEKLPYEEGISRKTTEIPSI
ncbi:MAG TPA: hypothetical protein DDY68_02925 [Porphyromonadaceae bacterium]|nr:hypothetical protein [Porphyromonadaceae bacterium]